LQLGELLILLECLLDRRQAVNTLILRAHSSSAHNVITALDFVIHLTKLQYCTLLETIFNLVEEISEPYKELFLLRTSKAIEDFSDVFGKDDASADADDGRIRTMRSSVLRKLVDIYLSQDEYPQAEQLLRQLHAPSTKSANTPEHAVAADPVTTDHVAAEQVAESFYLSSKKMVDVLQSFNVPAKYMRWLDCAGNDPFPSIERAMIDQSPVVARILHETGRCGLDDADILLRCALHIAAETSDLALLDLVLQRSPQLLSSRDVCQMTALCIAAYYGHTEFFTALVAAGADLRHRDEDGRSILSIASGAGHFEIVLFILSQGFSPNDDGVLHVCSPLHAAAAGGHLHVCELLVERGAYANWFSNGKTPAQVADENGHSEVATMIRNAEDRAQNQFPTDRHGHAKSNVSDAIRSPLPEPTVHVAQPKNLSLTPVPHADLLSTETRDSNMSSPLNPSWVFAEGDQ
jgi:ankyrin repeat protein